MPFIEYYTNNNTHPGTKNQEFVNQVASTLGLKNTEHISGLAPLIDNGMRGKNNADVETGKSNRGWVIYLPAHSEMFY